MRTAKLLTFFFSSSIDPGLDYLQNDAKLFYDFTTLTGADGTAIASVEDLSGNGRDLSNAAPAGDPTIKKIQVGSDLINTFKAVPSSGSKDVLIGNYTGTGLFDGDFEVVWVMNYEGPSAQTTQVLGVNNSNNKFFISINNNQWNIQYQYSAATARSYAAISSSTILPIFPTGKMVCRLKFDFTNDVNTLQVNGVDVTLTKVGGFADFNLLEPEKWVNTVQQVAIGGYNNGGTIAANLTTCNHLKLAITPIMTEQQWSDVAAYFNGETLASKRIVSFSDLKTNAIRKTTSNTTFSFGIALSGTAPSSDVTVSFASSLSKFTASASLTFTSANYLTPQTVTLTGVNDGVVDIAIIDTLTMTCSGGGYDGITKEMEVNIYDNVVMPFANMFGIPTWSHDLHVTSSNAATIRANALAFLFNGLGLPATSATVQTAGYTGTMHNYTSSDFTGWTSIDKLTCNYTDKDTYVWTYKMYHLKVASPVGLMVVHQGHETNKDQQHQLIINALLAENYDVIFCAMPLHGENTTTNPSVTYLQHVTIKTALDGPSWSPLCLYLNHVTQAINYAIAARSYNGNVNMTGISGGGWTTINYASIDTRIIKSFPVRGHMIRAWDVQTGDFEQGDNLANSGANVYGFYTSICSYTDMMVLAGNNGLTKILGNTNDIVVAHYSNRYWIPKLQEINPISGEIKSHVSTNPAYAAHAYDAEIVPEIINEL